ncbi:MAG: hypothetical protein EHM70_10075 [Chloroflexota bacterium]|nr:MAG: hypothetical protein EHM70_10075 [Chloroflexota bacterium]
MDLPLIIFLAVVFTVIGIILDNLVRSLRSEEPAKPAAPAASTSPEPGLQPGVHVWEDPNDHHIEVVIDGDALGSPAMLDPVQREKLVSLKDRLVAWLGEMPLPPVVRTARPAVEPPPPAPADPGAEKAEARPGGSLRKAISNFTQTEPKPPAKSIAAQVDEILQEMLKETPLVNRAVRLMDAGNQGLVVMVGLDKYGGIDEVPDEEIRQAIRAAVEVWKTRSMSSAT